MKIKFVFLFFLLTTALLFSENEFNAFQKVLTQKCDINSSIVKKNFDVKKGVYNGSIDCSSSGLTNQDLITFKIANKVIGELNLKSNQLTNLKGLSNLTYVGSSLYLNNNQIENLDDLQKLTHVGSVLALQDNNLTNLKELSKVTKIASLYLYSNNIIDYNTTLTRSELKKIKDMSIIQGYDNNISDYNSTSVTFRWEGNEASSYHLIVKKEDPIPVDEGNSNPPKPHIITLETEISLSKGHNHYIIGSNLESQKLLMQVNPKKLKIGDIHIFNSENYLIRTTITP